MNIAVFTRHSKGCPRSLERHGRRCKCWKYLDVRHDDSTREIISAKTRSWQEAEEKAQAILQKHIAGQPVLAGKMTVSKAVENFIEARRAENRKEQTIRIIKLLLDDRLVKFCQARGFQYLYQIRLADLEEFRSTWPGEAITRHKMQERLKSFFRYCHLHEWIERNPALGLKRINVPASPTQPFTPEEFEAMMAAATDPKERAFLLVLRWTGLRMSDAVSLTRDKVKDGKVFLYTQKTGTPVTVPIKPEIVEALDALPKIHPQYLFWSGNGTLETARKRWGDRFQRIVKAAGITHRAHPHMLRDTFAVELLLKGVPLDQVSILLGHSSVRITEKSYSPWVHARQVQLEESVRKAW